MTLTVGSLFSGIGGLDLGLERAGMDVIWQSEIDPYACKVLSKHWPEVVNHGNIKEINWGDVVRPDIICGGYPCQPFSTAGKRNGTDDPRHLWPWVREAISVLRPDFAILENVRGHVSLGLDIVLREMAAIGYDAEWQIVSAASVGAPHRRDRVLIVAYPNGRRLEECQPQTEQTTGSSFSGQQCTDAIGELADTDSLGCVDRQPPIFTADRWIHALGLIGASRPNLANTNRLGLERSRTEQSTSRSPRSGKNEGKPMADTDSTSREQQQERQVQERHTQRRSEQIPDTSRERSGRFGTLGQSREPLQQQRDNPRGEDGHAGRQWWTVEPDVGRVAHGVPARVDRLRGLGNAVVPHVAELIGRMIINYTDKEEQ